MSLETMKFNVSECNEYSRKGMLEEWVHLFLNSAGNNPEFSKGLKLYKRYWLGPVMCDLNKLKRCCGPEQDIKFYEPVENWERRINTLMDLINNGWDMPPLIVNDENGYFEVNDGNHRHEAMIRLGIKKYWVIFWGTTSKKVLEGNVKNILN